MRVSEPVNRLMTEEVLAIDVNAAAGEILRYFAQYPVHHLPVIDKNRVVGMLSSADVIKLEAFLPKMVADPIEYLNRHLRIEQIMRKPPITIGPHAAVEQAASLMAKHGVHALPVVTEPDGHLLGIITTTDIIHAALHPSQSDQQGNGDTSETPTAQAHVSPTQLQRALSLAADQSNAAGELGELARALLSVDARRRSLDAVFICAERYVSAGQDEHLHAALLKTIQKARESSGNVGSALQL